MDDDDQFQRNDWGAARPRIQLW